jgi:RNA-directed DNA polymerase
MGGWAVAQSPTMLTTVTLERLKKRGYEPTLKHYFKVSKRGYEPMLDHYLKVSPQLNEPLYTRTVRTVV